LHMNVSFKLKFTKSSQIINGLGQWDYILEHHSVTGNP
jgi:hypothetical protein